MSAALSTQAVAPLDRESGVLPAASGPLYAGPIVIIDGRAVLALLEHDPMPDPSDGAPWGDRLVVRARNFKIVPTQPRKTSAKMYPRGRDAPQWTRIATALERWIDGRATTKEIWHAMAHERATLPVASRPFPGPPDRRYRPAENRPGAKPKIEAERPTFSDAELAEAAVILKGCRCEGVLLERAWLELKEPPPRCKPADSLRVRVERAIERARRRLREDACRRVRSMRFDNERMVNDGEPLISLGGRTGVPGDNDD